MTKSHRQQVGLPGRIPGSLALGVCAPSLYFSNQCKHTPWGQSGENNRSGDLQEKAKYTQNSLLPVRRLLHETWAWLQVRRSHCPGLLTNGGPPLVIHFDKEAAVSLTALASPVPITCTNF